MDFVFIFYTVLALLCCTTASSLREIKQQDINSLYNAEYTHYAGYFFHQRYPRDCQEVRQQCFTTNSSGVYVIKPNGISEPFEVFCDQDIDNGGWTVILRRANGSVNFNKSWTQYKEGFGFLATELWLGNEKLSYITHQAVYELRVDFQMSTGEHFYTTYKGFRITDEFGEYKLSYIGTFEGTSVITSCPPNMKYKNCVCQKTCEDPNGESGCHRICSGDEGCVCPDGFSLSGSECIRENECGCFSPDANMVIPDGEAFVNDACTRRCSCTNNQLNCEDISCSTHAVCVTSNEARQCVCNEGFQGDGYTCEALHTDCKDVYDAGNTQDGVYTIMPSGWTHGPFPVYCKMDNGGGWTVFQKRVDGNTNFHRSWNEYKGGFGDLVSFSEDFWLGNDKLYYLTNQRNYKLRFDIITSSGSSKYAEFTEFQIESESTNYRMNKLGARSGSTGATFDRSRNKQFSTTRRDNDECSNFNCAEKHRSGWWHSNHWCSRCSDSYCHRFLGTGNCHTVCTNNNLNGDYSGGNGQTINSYFGFKAGNVYCNLRYVEMKIRPLP